MFCALRNAKQKKTVPAKNSEANFLAAPFHKAPPGRQKSEREFCLFGGVFLRSVCRAVCRGGLFCEACRCCACPALPLPAMRFACAVPSCFGCLFACRAFCAHIFLLSFAFSCLAFAAQTSFHLSLRPRREFPCLSPPAALFPACGSCHLLLFHGLLRPLPVFPFCVVRTGFLSCFSLVFLPFPA